MSRRAPGKEEASKATVDLVGFNCPSCSLPLKPPVYQCTAGSLVCSSCHEGSNCDSIWGSSFTRSYTVERMLESVRFPCTNASRGCAAMTPYHRWADHEDSCPHSTYDLSSAAQLQRHTWSGRFRMALGEARRSDLLATHINMAMPPKPALCANSNRNKKWKNLRDTDYLPYISAQSMERENINYQCSPKALPPIMKRVIANDQQKGYVIEIGFGSFLSMADFEMNKALTLWLVDKFNCDTEALEFEGGISIPVRPLVKSVLGIPSGPIPVVEGPDVDKALYAQYSCNGRAKNAKEVADEMCSITDKEPFCIAFMMVILGIYLAPNSSVEVNRALLGAVKQVDKLKDMDWYVVQKSQSTQSIYADCYCTEPACGFFGQPLVLLSHLAALHSVPVHKVHYGEVHQLQVSEPRYLLHGVGDNCVFLLAVDAYGAAIVVSVVCIRAGASP
ncbi:hypothetical protein ACQ4PT_035057 [Festuca glaucescens]